VKFDPCASSTRLTMRLPQERLRANIQTRGHPAPESTETIIVSLARSAKCSANIMWISTPSILRPALILLQAMETLKIGVSARERSDTSMIPESPSESMKKPL